MTKEQIVGLAVKLYAVFLFIYGIRTVPGLIRLTEIGQLPIQSYLYIGIYIVVFLVCSVLLWFFPVTVARKILPLDDRKPEEKTATASDIELIAFTILGLWVLSRAVPDMIYWISIVSFRPHEFGVFTLSHRRISAIVSTLFELAIGVWFLLGAKGLRGLIRKLRYAGS